jgi:hypothetical protein
MLGTFVNQFLPQLQVLAAGADAVHTIFMQVIKIG